MLTPFIIIQSPQVVQTGEAVVVTSGATRLAVSLKDGRYTLGWGSQATVKEATSAVRLGDGRERWANDYTRHVAETAEVGDALGKGIKVVVRHTKDGEPELVTTFWLYANRPEAYVRVDAVSPTAISTDRMLPIIADRGVDLDAGDPLQVLFVPFDNDMFVRYHSQNWSEEGESYEVGAAYDNRSRHGLVVGSVDHDVWKSAVQVRGRGAKRIGKLFAYAGAAGQWTHDKEPHGKIEGTTLRSPRMFIGGFADWRDGMEAYGKANALLKPAPSWLGDPPFGWNSWSAVKETLNAGHVRAATGFMSTYMKSHGFRYVNMDAFWDYIKEEDRAALVKEIHAMGLKAGIYWTPFAAWGDDLSAKVEGIRGDYTYRDLTIKDRNGNPLPKVDNGWPLDPTHPGTRARNAAYYARFAKWGFDFVKLDFTSHGSNEGRHHDPRVTTGIQAYNLGMADAGAGLKGMFIGLSIAPLFPHGVAHARRISCDAFADIGQTEYVMNALTYGWWSHGTIYPYNDPDHTVVFKVHNEGEVSEVEGRTRLAASIVAGGMLLNGDDLTSGGAQARVAKLFLKARPLELARRGLTFRPVEGDTGSAAADAFVLRDGKAAYLAVFNYARGESKKKRIDLERAGFGKGYRWATDLWTGREWVIGDFLTLNLEPKDHALLLLQKPEDRVASGMRKGP